jgi:hypothetical protein
MEMVIRQSDRISYLPGCMGRGWSSNNQEHLIVSFDSSVTVLRSNQVVCLAWIWIGIRFCEYKLMDTESSSFSTPIITTSHRL